MGIWMPSMTSFVSYLSRRISNFIYAYFNADQERLFVGIIKAVILLIIRLKPKVLIR